jgi:hypothetical protein
MFQVSVGRVGVGNRAELPGMGQAAPGNFHTPSFSRINETASSPVEELAELLAQASEGGLVFFLRKQESRLLCACS